MMVVEIVTFALFGLVFGSFSNVLIYRLPRKIPFGMSRSRCNDCGTQIKGYDNIPVISFILLGGKCRTCKSKISWQYPIIELFVAFLWVLPILLKQKPEQALISAVFTTILTIIAVIDFSHLIIPDSLVIAIAVLSIPGFILKIPPRWSDRLIGFFAVSVIIFVFAILSEKILKKEGFGGGDIKLTAAVGLILGWKLGLIAFGMSAFIALFMILIMKLFSKALNEEKQIPFAPALSTAMAITYYFGESLINWYLGLIFR